MSLNRSRRGYPLVDPDLSIGKEWGYRDPHRVEAVVYAGPPMNRVRPKRRTA